MRRVYDLRGGKNIEVLLKGPYELACTVNKLESGGMSGCNGLACLANVKFTFTLAADYDVQMIQIFT